MAYDVVIPQPEAELLKKIPGPATMKIEQHLSSMAALAPHTSGPHPIAPELWDAARQVYVFQGGEYRVSYSLDRTARAIVVVGLSKKA